VNPKDKDMIAESGVGSSAGVGSTDDR